MFTIYKAKVTIAKPVINLVAKPTPVTFIGPGKILKTAELLKMNNIQKALIVTDDFLYNSGLLSAMLDRIKEEGIEVVIFSQVTPDPTFEVVAKAQDGAQDCQAVVAVGGGSVLDTAKAVSAAIANHTSAARLAGMLKVKKRPLPLIAVPTTAGTGSETTVAAIISDSSTHLKKQILDPKIVPIMAILDPEITVGLPPHLTAFTAMDALTHALEAYVSNYASEETDRYSEIAIKLIYENLDKVYNNPKDMEGREALLVASFFAGMAFTRTYVGYVHAFAHTIGGKYGYAHGMANAVLLPHIMREYEVCCKQRFAKLYDLVTLPSDSLSKEEKARRFVDSIYAMNKRFNIPEKFEKFPKSDMEMITKIAFKESHGTYPVPVYFSMKKAKELLEKVSV